MATEEKRGLDRRQFLRKAAATGAAVAWTAPVVKTITGTPAFAQSTSGSPQFQDLSYVVVFYTCADHPGETGAVKWDIGGGVETGNFNMPDCGGFSGGTFGDPSHFAFSSSGTTASVCLSEAGIAAGCSITSGVAKCGSGQSTTNTCVSGTGGGNCMSFSGCGGP